MHKISWLYRHEPFQASRSKRMSYGFSLSPSLFSLSLSFFFFFLFLSLVFSLHLFYFSTCLNLHKLVKKSVWRASQSTAMVAKSADVMLYMQLSAAKWAATSGQCTLSFLTVRAETQTQSL